MTAIHQRPEQISVGEASGPRFKTRSIVHGAIAASAMATFYLVVVRAASGSWSHLRYFEELSQEQIAERIGTSQMHVGRLIASSLAQLRRHLADDPTELA